MTENMFVLGLDLGQAADYTAIAIAEKIPRPGGLAEYHLRHLERPKLGTPYPDICQRVKTLITKQPAELVIDATGVGRAVVDLFDAAGLYPSAAITITGGNAVTRAGRDYGVPKRDLASILQVVLQTGRLKIAEGIPEASTLVNELLNFRVKISASGHDSYEAWREGIHDDLVLATALAVWWADQQGTGESVIIPPTDYIAEIDRGGF